MTTCYMYSCDRSTVPGVVMAEGSRTSKSEWEAVTSSPPLSGFLFLLLKSVPPMMPSVTKPHSQAALTKANAVLDFQPLNCELNKHLVFSDPASGVLLQ